ncbi:MAG: tRNA lysidine(34) synthetase TilS [Actinomycetales bacterium]|nr:tRNA lysidine(34) synthetase TilS [Actinomycetales bacterium]
MAGPHPDVATARLAVRTAVEDLPGDALVLVACSGGPDSLALAAAAAFALPRAGLRAGAVVVDHALQDGSAEVAARAAAQCRELGLDPVEVHRVEVGTAGGMEAAARDARYGALTEAAARLGAAAVLLGHTLDDQAETVLLGLARGSGARSLAGMAATRGILRRPLLGMRRAQLLEVCVAAGLDPWHDPTNTDPHGPRRSALRARVMPTLAEVLGPGVPEALARTAEQLREDAEALDPLAARLLERARADDGDPRGERPSDPAVGPEAPADDGEPRVGARPRPAVGQRYDIATLAAEPPAIRRRTLRLAALAAGASAGALSREHVLALDALVTSYRGQGAVALPDGAKGHRERGMLIISGPGVGP